MKIIGTIPARMQSSRFYGKPLAKILGKEMILWVYENSRKSELLSEIYVATDHEDIANFCKKKNIPHVMTSDTHQNCSERSNEVGQKLGADLIVEIQGDEPVVKASELDHFISESLKIKNFDVSLFYSDATADEAQNPHVVKLVMNQDKRALFFSRSPIPHNFKDKPVNYYKQVGLYLWKAEALKRFSSMARGYLEGIEDTHTLRLIENDFDAALVYTPHQSLGVDLPSDIEKVEKFILSQGNK